MAPSALVRTAVIHVLSRRAADRPVCRHCAAVKLQDARSRQQCNAPECRSHRTLGSCRSSVQQGVGCDSRSPQLVFVDARSLCVCVCAQFYVPSKDTLLGAGLRSIVRGVCAGKPIDLDAAAAEVQQQNRAFAREFEVCLVGQHACVCSCVTACSVACTGG